MELISRTEAEASQKRTKLLFRTASNRPEGLPSSKGAIPWPGAWLNDLTLFIDEAGLGALAGPLYAAVVYIRPSFRLPGAHDSKLLKEHEREALFEQIVTNLDVIYAIDSMSNSEIDEIGIKMAWHVLTKRLVENLLAKKPDVTNVVVDGSKFIADCPLAVCAMPKADRSVLGVAMASILAKVSRDRFMHSAALTYPRFREIFESGKGYWHSKAHADLLKQGIYTDLHRKSFAPLKDHVRVLTTKRIRTQNEVVQN